MNIMTTDGSVILAFAVQDWGALGLVVIGLVLWGVFRSRRRLPTKGDMEVLPAEPSRCPRGRG